MAQKIAVVDSTLADLTSADAGAGDGTDQSLRVDDQGILWVRQWDPDNGVAPVPAVTSSTLLASAARTADTNTADQTNLYHKGVIVTIDVTLDPSTASVVYTIQGKDAAGTYYTILQSASIADVGTTVLKVYPGLVAVANLAVSHPLPGTWRVNCNHTDAESITYSVSAELIP